MKNDGDLSGRFLCVFIIAWFVALVVGAWVLQWREWKEVESTAGRMRTQCCMHVCDVLCMFVCLVMCEL